MTTVIRRKRASRSSIGPYRRHELLTGRIQYPVQGYTDYGDGVGTDLTAFPHGGEGVSKSHTVSGRHTAYLKNI